MRILHILDHSIPLQSGYTFRTRNILREQNRRGWQTCHVTGLKQLYSQKLEEDVDGLHFYRTLSPNGSLRKIPLVNQLQVVATLERRIGEIIRMERPDILHAHSPALNGLAALRAGRKCGLPVVYECRAFWEDAAVDHGTSSENGARYRLTRALETRVFTQADAITTICEGLRQDILERGVPEAKVSVIPNAVDPDTFTFDAAKDARLLSELALENRLVLGFIGSFYAYEGLLLLLDAMPDILTSLPEAVLLLVGGGPDEDKIVEKIRSLGIEQSVICTGRVPHDEISRYYSLIDLFVYPRLSMRLTNLVTPLKPLEAMAQGKLVVASDVGGHRELISHGKNGFLFSADSVLALAQKATEIVGQRESWPAVRKAARDYVERERNWVKSVDGYENVYRSLR